MSKKKQLNGSADEVEAAFYDAISRGDLEAMMALWAEDEEIVCIHPSAPRLIGHAAIRASWESIFERGHIAIHPIQLHVTHNMLSSVHSIVEDVKRGENDTQDIHILATNVYVKTPHGWRITTHHASVAPGKMPVDLFKASMLH
jgi:ketosteroid isomerase-like protein